MMYVYSYFIVTLFGFVDQLKAIKKVTQCRVEAAMAMFTVGYSDQRVHEAVVVAGTI